MDDLADNGAALALLATGALVVASTLAEAFPMGSARREFEIDREGYYRKGYYRKPYTRADGTRVQGAYVQPTYVPPTSFQIEDPGRPGRTARGAQEGPHAQQEPWITRQGKLGGPGYTDKPQSQRRKILDRCVRQYGYRSCLGSIMVLERNTELHASTKKKLKSDHRYLVSTYGGPGAFRARSKPKKKSKKKGSRARTAYTRFIGRRVKELTTQGYDPKQAMKLAASEYRVRS